MLVKLASEDCQVSEYGEWGECAGAVCGSTGKQYRQRFYKNPERATKCHRKLFDTKTCNMSRCSHGINDSMSHVKHTLPLEFSIRLCFTLGAIEKFKLRF